MDALTTMLAEVRSAGALFGRNIMGSPWAIRFEDGAALTLVTMLRGAGWIVPDNGTPVRLENRDRAIVSGTAPFTVTDDITVSTPPLYVLHSPDRCTTSSGEVVDPDELNLGIRTCGTRLDGDDVLLTGTYYVHGEVSGHLLGSLPPVLVVPHEYSASAHLDLTEAEIARDDPGQQAVLDRLLDLLLIATLRDWFAGPDGSPPPWYQAISDPTVGAALRAIHAHPERPWTVHSLAREAQISRAALARRFTELLGEPPIAYLTTWRLSLAADLLRRTDSTVDTIARRVGYSPSYALSAAFTRHFGVRPTVHRSRAHLASPVHERHRPGPVGVH